MLFANGVARIFYHAGTCDVVNRDSLQGIFFEYGGEPHMIYAAQAVMAHLFTPACRFVKRLTPGDSIKGYLFRDGTRLVGVVWALPGAAPRSIRLEDKRLRLRDIMGRPGATRGFTPTETPEYIIGDGLPVEAFEAGLR